MRVVPSPFAAFPLVLAGTLPAQAFLHAPMVVLSDDSPPFQRLADFDGDGDPDAVGSRVRNDGNVELRVWRNDAGSMVSAWTTVVAMGTIVTPGVGVVATGDLDGDGDPEFAVGAGTQVIVATNLGGMQFSVVGHDRSALVIDVVIGDLDGDGRGDLATLAQDLQVRTHGAVLSTQGLFVNMQPQPRLRLQAVDLDGDALPEIALMGGRFLQGAEVTGGTLQVLPFVQHPSISPQATLVLWAAGDIDRDGDADAVAFDMSAVPAQVHVVRRTGASSWATEAPYVGGPAEYLADVDGDGDLDGVCCGGGGGGGGSTIWPKLDFASTFEIAINEGGVFAPAHAFGGWGSRSMAGVGDLDADGHADLVAGACVLSGRGFWPTHPLPPTGASPAEVHPEAVGDRDGDGDPDVGSNVFGRHGNRGDGTFAPVAASGAVPAGTFAFPGGFVGDFDGNGSVDEVCHLYSSTSPYAFVAMGLWSNNGSGVMRYVGRPCAAGVRMGLGWQSEQADAADLDDDGDLDLIGNSDPRIEARHSEVFWNDGSAFFTAGPTFGGERLEGAADLDGDGRTDLVTSIDSTGDLRLRLGTGLASPRFQAPVGAFPGTAVGSFCEAVTLADADGDGRTDLLVASAAGEMHLWENVTVATGQPAFSMADASAYVRLPVSSGNPYQRSPRIVAVDVDGDGVRDLIAGPTVREEVLVVYRRLPGAGGTLAASSYQPPIAYVAPMGIPDDADGDGDLDLVGTNVVRNLASAQPVAGLRRQYGTGSPGEAGVTPLLGATGPFRGDHFKTLRLRGITGPTIGVFAIGLLPADLPGFPLPGVHGLVDPTFLSTLWFQVSPVGGGQAQAGIDILVYLPPALIGVNFFDQAFVLDPAGPSSVAASNGLHIRIGS